MNARHEKRREWKRREERKPKFILYIRIIRVCVHTCVIPSATHELEPPLYESRNDVKSKIDFNAMSHHFFSDRN